MIQYQIKILVNNRYSLSKMYEICLKNYDLILSMRHYNQRSIRGVISSFRMMSVL